MQVVWFKRDCRLVDHQALVSALKEGPVLPLYVLEPELWQQPDMSQRHYLFLIDCLKDLDQALKKQGQRLVVRVGDAVDVLDSLHRQVGISSIWSHQETWNGWTYQRDLKVGSWAKKHQINWHEPVQNGVIRCLNNRDGWAANWFAQMMRPKLPLPERIDAVFQPSDPLPSPADLDLADDGCDHRQLGGREHALSLLRSFLHERGEGYTKEMSSPWTAYESCSRLSAHLAFGTVSMREVMQAVESRREQLHDCPPYLRVKWPGALKSFSARLRWHCHFIQKLEDEPRIEFENLHPAYDQFRQDTFNEATFQAWKTGMTGYPMVDACMRALTKTGWLNFRMRAMLMSFASYHLWLHWRKPALHLAQLFTDYEPGIHYSQVQMQSGTTGINSIRIYNPIKQGVDQDPDGLFIRQWVPELREVSDDFIHTPWLDPAPPEAYPEPIVDEKTARQFAAGQLHGLRKQGDHAKAAQGIVKKHASRKRPRKAKTKVKQPKNQRQMELDL